MPSRCRHSCPTTRDEHRHRQVSPSPSELHLRQDQDPTDVATLRLDLHREPNEGPTSPFFGIRPLPLHCYIHQLPMRSNSYSDDSKGGPSHLINIQTRARGLKMRPPSELHSLSPTTTEAAPFDVDLAAPVKNHQVGKFPSPLVYITAMR